MNAGRGEIRLLVRALRIAGALVLILALLTLSLADAAQARAAVVMAAVLVSVPLVRIAALSVEWLRKGDRRFGLLAMAQVVLVLLGWLITVWTR